MKYEETHCTCPKCGGECTGTRYPIDRMSGGIEEHVLGPVVYECTECGYTWEKE